MFSQPSLEILSSEEVYTLNADCRLPLSDGSAGQAFISFLFKGPTFGDDVTASTASSSPLRLQPTDFTPTLPKGVYLQLPTPLTLNSDTGATGAPENAIVTALAVHNVSGNDVIRFAYTKDNINYLWLDGSKPFSIRPTACPIFEQGTAFEEDMLTGNGAAAVSSIRNRRSLTSSPVLKKLSTGKVVSMISSLRF